MSERPMIIPADVIDAAQFARSALDHAAGAAKAGLDLNHDDLYASGAVLISILRNLGELATALAHQIRHYGECRVSNGIDGDLHQRLADAANALAMLRVTLDRDACSAANAYFFAIGRVNSKINPDTNPDFD